VNVSSPQARLPVFGFLFAVIFKFWLIWESEISDAVDDPHEYILQVLYPLNGGLAYGPGTGWIGRLFYDLQIPFRFAIEALFLVACTLVLRALFAWPWRNWLSLGLFLFVIFDPAPAELFSHFYSDQVWLVETMIGFSCLVIALQDETRPNWILVNVAALFLALSTVTRSAFIPLMAGLSAFTLLGLVLLLLKNRQGKGRGAIGTLALSMASLLLLIGIIYEGDCAYNLKAHGYSGISSIDCAEYKEFYFCLQSVGEPTGRQYYPVDENRRELIAQAGPTSSWFMHGLDPRGYLKKVGMEHYGTSDIAGGWLQFAVLNEAFYSSGGDLRTCFALFKVIENEIADADRRGVVKVRSIIPLPDSRLGIIVPAYPRALYATLNETAHEPTSAELILNPQLHYDSRIFTAALHRHAIHESPVRNLIWILLCGIYGLIYTPWFVDAYLIVWLFSLGVFISRWNRIKSLSLHRLAQQIFGFFFLVLIFWYALFDVAGWPTLSRYMIFNHVLLPVLLVYYLVGALQLLRDERLERRGDG